MEHFWVGFSILKTWIIIIYDFFFSISQRLLNRQYFQNVPDIIYVRDDSRFLKRPRRRVSAPLSELPCGSWKYCSQFSSIPRWSWKIIWEQREDSCSNLHLSPTLFLTASPAHLLSSPCCPPSPLITLILKAASPWWGRSKWPRSECRSATSSPWSRLLCDFYWFLQDRPSTV